MNTAQIIEWAKYRNLHFPENAPYQLGKISEKSMGESADSEEEINGHLVELIDESVS